MRKDYFATMFREGSEFWGRGGREREEKATTFADLNETGGASAITERVGAALAAARLAPVPRGARWWAQPHTEVPEDQILFELCRACQCSVAKAGHDVVALLVPLG